jgi:hypothetical protein
MISRGFRLDPSRLFGSKHDRTAYRSSGLLMRSGCGLRVERCSGETRLRRSTSSPQIGSVPVCPTRAGSVLSQEMFRPRTTAEPTAQLAIELYSINRQPEGWFL